MPLNDGFACTRCENRILDLAEWADYAGIATTGPEHREADIRLLPGAVVILGLFVSSAPAEVIVDARPDASGGVWSMTPGSERDVFVYLHVGSASEEFTSFGAQLAVLISGSASPLPNISTIDLSGTGYVYEGVPQGSFVAIDASAGYRDCFIFGDPKLVDTNRRVLARVHLTTTADVPLGDYVLDPGHEFGPPLYYVTEIDQPDPPYP
jgi:hypothetical protein